MKLSIKQTQAIDILEDNITEELLYGGAAGGAKTVLGCYWQLKRRYQYPGSRGFIGRAVAKTLKDTTLKTFFEVAGWQGLKRGNHFDLTGPWDKENPNCIVFANSSLIFLRDLFQYPSDPDFDELGSLEITDAFVDECSQVGTMAKDTLKTRIRYGLTKWNLIPKILFGTNPTKNWAYNDFYRAAREGKLLPYRRFLQAFVTDNPFAPYAYVNSLRNMPEGPQKQRLFHGNWEYDDDPATLIEYDKILEAFEGDEITFTGERYITADIARFGKDKTVIGIWVGFIVELFAFNGLSVSESAANIKDLQQKFGITSERTIVDEDGVGGGVMDILKCKGFINNSSPLPNPVNPDRNDKGEIIPENYINLKSQCYFRLADRVNKSGLFIKMKDQKIKLDIIQELEQVKQFNMDKDGKRQILPKDKVKEIIGRSPDFSDTLMMREWFELTPKFEFITG